MAGRRTHRRQDEETTYWLSYSDMMAGLLLCFVLIIALTVLHSKIQYDQKQLELQGKEEELVIRSDELENERTTVAAQQALLDTQREQLEKQRALLDTQADVLNAQEQALADQGDKLALQQKELEEQNSKLVMLQALLDEQQVKLDNIIGVRSDLIEALKDEFQNSNLKISVDEQTGSITFDSSILFDYNEDELKPNGEAFLSEFLPRYVSVLLSDDYKDYISEILIEGHTDTDGGYMPNLDLSQRRAYSVAEYCLSGDNDIITSSQLNAMRKLVGVTGRSYSQPVYKTDGRTVDMDASRRVEFLFRLKDEEMIREMIEILSSDEQ